MLKAIPGISKKILVVSIVALFLVSMMFFVSPGKIYALSADATLSNLTVSAGTLVPAFNSATLAYTVELPFGTVVVPTVTPITTEGSATVVVTNATSVPGLTNVHVTAGDGVTTKDYTFTFIDYYTIFDDVHAALITAGIDNNIDIDIFGSTPTSCSGLWFKKIVGGTVTGHEIIGGTAIGKITFANGLNLTSSDTITFLQALYNNLNMSNGMISFNTTLSAIFRATGATLEMYGMPDGTLIDQLVVRDNAGTILPTSSVVGGFSCLAGTVTFNASHFTSFEIIAASTTQAPYKPMTAEEQVLRNLLFGQQVDLYGKTTTGFVKMLYDNILGRVPDDEGLNNWVTALNDGKITLGSAVYNFVFSKELEPIISSASPIEFITFLYKNVFNREQDSEGYNGWLSAMKNGMSKEDVLLHFIEGDEFKNICTMFNLKP